MAAKDNTVMPIVRRRQQKMYCSSSQAVLVVRRRRHVINGGGFVVTDCSQKFAFKVDGCGILGKRDEMILRDSDGDALLIFRRKIGVKKELMASEDLYQVVVTPGTDEAFVIGVITILDYIYGESTRC